MALTSVVTKLQAEDDGFREELQQSGRSVTKFADIAKGAFAGILAAKAFEGIVGGIRSIVGGLSDLSAESTELFNIQQAAVSRLNQQLATTGRELGISSKAIQEWASQRQQITKFGDEATIESAAVLARYQNIESEAFLESLAVVQDLAEAKKMELGGAAEFVGKALNAPIEGMGALADVGIVYTQAQKDVIAAMVDSGDVAGAQAIILGDLQDAFEGTAEAAADTAEGSLVQFDNRLGDVKEQLGEALQPIKDWILQGKEITLTIVEGIMPAVIRLGEAIGNLANEIFPRSTASAGDWSKMIGNAIDEAAFTVENFWASTEKTLTSWELGLTETFEDTKFFFTTGLAEILKASGQTLVNWFKDMVGYVRENASQIFDPRKWFDDEKLPPLEFTPRVRADLTRAETDAEKQLKRDLERVNERLGRRRAEFEAAKNAVEDEPPILPPPEEVEQFTEALAEGPGEVAETFKSAIIGGAELFSRIQGGLTQSAFSGSPGDGMKEQVAVSKQQLTAQEQTNALLGELVNQNNVAIVGA